MTVCTCSIMIYLEILVEMNNPTLYFITYPYVLLILYIIIVSNLAWYLAIMWDAINIIMTVISMVTLWSHLVGGFDLTKIITTFTVFGSN